MGTDHSGEATAGLREHVDHVEIPDGGLGRALVGLGCTDSIGKLSGEVSHICAVSEVDNGFHTVARLANYIGDCYSFSVRKTMNVTLSRSRIGREECKVNA